MEQIRQLILEQPVRHHRRQGRPMGRVAYDDEVEDWSDGSAGSQGTRFRPRRGEGGSDH
ncbi:hypothetical protein A2U01_0085484, partial [Trifolium medium]|nr:hypothetical protein [Trifolium medium]